MIIAGSSNGRTSPFGGEYLGSNPSPAALRLATLAQCRPSTWLNNLHRISTDQLTLCEEKCGELVEPRMYFVYIIECSDRSLYTGTTNDIERRFDEHKSGTGGNYTRAKKVERILYTEEHPSRSIALKRESQIKKWTRAKKEALIRVRGDKKLLKKL